MEPFGAIHEELLVAIVAREIANRSFRHCDPAAELKDFMPSHRPEPMTGEEIKAVLHGVVLGHGTGRQD